MDLESSPGYRGNIRAIRSSALSLSQAAGTDNYGLSANRSPGRSARFRLDRRLGTGRSVLAEIGVVLLLFTVGIEVSLKDLLKIKKFVLVGGSLQVILTILAVFAILYRIGMPAGEAMMLGFLVSLSSTAIVLRIIQKRSNSTASMGGRPWAYSSFRILPSCP